MAPFSKRIAFCIAGLCLLAPFAANTSKAVPPVRFRPFMTSFATGPRIFPSMPTRFFPLVPPPQAQVTRFPAVPLRFVPSAQSAVNPDFFVAPGLTVRQAAFNTALLGRALSFVPPYALGFNPYSMYFNMASMYPYYGSSYPMYGYGYPAYGASYLGTMPQYNPYSALMTTPSYGSSNSYRPANPAPANQAPLATAAAPPDDSVNGLLKRNGSLEWPLGLRLLRPGIEVEQIRSEIDFMMRKALAQSRTGKADTNLVEGINRRLDKLQDLLAKEANQLPVSHFTITEADRFLQKVKGMLKAL